VNIFCDFIIYKNVQVIFFGKSINKFMFVLPDSLFEFARDADIKCAIPFVCKYIDRKNFFHRGIVFGISRLLEDSSLEMTNKGKETRLEMINTHLLEMIKPVSFRPSPRVEESRDYARDLSTRGLARDDSGA